ncbi:amidohydrolase family protein [Kocuria sp. p3-SID1433]|nr:amidohydrolase family protein [Kocuria sp. p3-SID1428]MCT2180635.1 amidohydrolase family protein [Kocuria sp. p3-SID1433]
MADSAGERATRAMGVRLDLVGAVELSQADLERIAAGSVTLCLDPSAEAPVAELYRRGIPVVWGTGADLLDSWEAVRDLLHHPDPQQRISARAAFVAATRGAWRALGGGHPMAGQLASGTPATYALWEVEALMVQQAEGTAAAWSTDPRARTPLLPALEDEAAPRCTQTVVEGRTLSRA